jgi:hypothetical protein
MTDEQLDAIRARNRARTPGDWRAEDGSVWANRTGSDANINIRVNLVAEIHRPYRLDHTGVDAAIAEEQANAEFIAHASEDIPALLAEVDFLRGLLADAAVDGQPMKELERLKRENEELKRQADATITTLDCNISAIRDVSGEWQPAGQPLLLNCLSPAESITTGQKETGEQTGAKEFKHGE